MTLSGTIEFHSANTLNLAFDATRVVVEVEQFNQDCVPVVSLTTLTGPFTISGGVVGASFAGSAGPLVFADDTTSGNDMVRLDGRVDSSCLGGAAALDTDTALLLPQSGGCPTAGSMLFTVMGQTDRITYTATGGVAIDVGNDGGPPNTYASCFDLQACPGG